MSPILSARGGLSANAYGWGALTGGGTSFESISSADGTGSSGTITLSSIPATYKHLQLRISMVATSGDCGLRVNSDSGTNYARHIIRGSGSAASAFGVASTDVAANLFPGGITGSYASVAVIDILDYASTSKYKTFRIFSGQRYTGSGYLEICSGLWMNTNAITSISLVNATTNWGTSTRVSLYGIKESA